jgi:hypothetical protein
MNLDEDKKKAFDFAGETTKQLITLSTGIVTITLTFAKDILKVEQSANKIVLMLSWVFFLISIIFGVWTLMALTGELEQIGSKKHIPTIRGKNVTVPSALQILFFVIGIGLAVAYGIISLS